MEKDTYFGAPVSYQPESHNLSLGFLISGLSKIPVPHLKHSEVTLSFAAKSNLIPSACWNLDQRVQGEQLGSWWP